MKTDINLTIVPMAGEKRTLRVPPTQFETSNINCLSLFVDWPALHALFAELPFFTGTIVLTISDKHTLQELQDNELHVVFICCLLLQLDSTMARCVVQKLADVSKVASQYAVIKTSAVSHIAVQSHPTIK